MKWMGTFFLGYVLLLAGILAAGRKESIQIDK
jgi:hypothetical protein